jgi:hypothetical protein
MCHDNKPQPRIQQSTKDKGDFGSLVNSEICAKFPIDQGESEFKSEKSDTSRHRTTKKTTVLCSSLYHLGEAIIKSTTSQEALVHTYFPQV